MMRWAPSQVSQVNFALENRERPSRMMKLTLAHVNGAEVLEGKKPTDLSLGRKVWCTQTSATSRRSHRNKSPWRTLQRYNTVRERDIHISPSSESDRSSTVRRLHSRVAGFRYRRKDRQQSWEPRRAERPTLSVKARDQELEIKLVVRLLEIQLTPSLHPKYLAFISAKTISQRLCLQWHRWQSGGPRPNPRCRSSGRSYAEATLVMVALLLPHSKFPCEYKRNDFILDSLTS